MIITSINITVWFIRMNGAVRNWAMNVFFVFIVNIPKVFILISIKLSVHCTVVVVTMFLCSMSIATFYVTMLMFAVNVASRMLAMWIFAVNAASRMLAMWIFAANGASGESALCVFALRRNCKLFLLRVAGVVEAFVVLDELDLQDQDRQKDEEGLHECVGKLHVWLAL